MLPFADFRRRAGVMVPGLTMLLRYGFQNALWRGNNQRREVAITFDDGPSREDSPQLLDLLARRDTIATFFHLGDRIEQHPDLVQAVSAAGHQIGIHGYRHRTFLAENSESLRGQLAYTRHMLSETSRRPVEDFCDVRPPYGTFSPGTLRNLISWGYRPVMWSVVPLHWMQPAAESIEHVEHWLAPGSIIVLHEGIGGPPLVPLVEDVIDRVDAAGYTPISIDQMWQSLNIVA
jgi:peptidoglycan/xylan/chitin deacetylase (PgdA/CDA1 family)